MPITAELFDGTRLEFPDDTDPSVIQSTAKRLTLERTPKKEGIGAAFESGVESFVSPTQTALESITGSPEEAAKRGLERQKISSAKYEGPNLEDIKKIYQEQGFLPAAKKAVSSIPEAISAQIPQLTAIGVGAGIGTIVGGALGTPADIVTGPGGTIAGAAIGNRVGAMIGQAIAEFPQFYGSDIERQAQVQMAQGKPVDINRLKAAGAAGFQTASDIFETQILFGSSQIGKLLGFSPKSLAEKSVESVEKMAKEKLLTTIAKGTAKGAAAEIPNEIFQQMLERAQAGLSVADADAMREYGSVAYQVGLLSPLGIVGSFGERGAARGEIAARGITPSGEPIPEPGAIVQPTTNVAEPVTQAGVAPVAPPIPKIPEITTTPTGMVTPVPPAPVAPPVTPTVPVAPPVAPPATPLGPNASAPSVEQNRNRSTPASIAQMQGIAANPMYQFVGASNTISGAGAPIVTGPVKIPESHQGHKGLAMSEDGTDIPFHYGVVEAKDLLPSHNADGTPNANYGSDHTGLRAVVGNGRTAGIQESYRKGTADQYVNSMKQDIAHGIDPKVIEGMKEPVLVRYADPSSIPSNIGDLSNTSGTLNLSTVEQAKNDANRIDLTGLNFDENGSITPNTIRQFVASMPTSERANLMDETGNTTRQAHDRLNAAIFHKAYGIDDLTALAHQSEDPEAKNVLKALSESASQMAQLQGTNEYDIRPQVAQAAQLAINARRNGIKLDDLVKQQDITAHPLTNDILQLFADNPRSSRNIADALKQIATNINEEVNKPAEGLFGAEPKRSVQDIIRNALKKEPTPDLFSPAEIQKRILTYQIDKPKEQIHDEVIKLKDHVELAQWSVDNAPNPFAKAIAEKLLQRMKEFKALGIPMSIDVLDGSRRPRGWYGKSQAHTVGGKAFFKISLRGLDKNGKADNSTGTRYSTILHELVHAASQSMFFNNGEYAKKIGKTSEYNKAYVQMTDLLKQIRKQVNKDKKLNPDEQHEAVKSIARGKQYIKNIDELLAYGLTDEKFQHYLSTIKLSNQKTGLSKLIDIIRGLLNINPEYESALDRLMITTDSVFTPTGKEIAEASRRVGIPFGKPETNFETDVSDNPAFKRWFGNSKVVNEDGSPKVMYHGTYENFSVPKTFFGDDEYYKFGFHVGTSEQASKRIEDLNKLGTFSRVQDKQPSVMPLYIKAVNPLRLDEDRVGRWGIDDIMKIVMEKAEKGEINGITPEAIDDYYNDRFDIESEMGVGTAPGEAGYDVDKEERFWNDSFGWEPGEKSAYLKAFLQQLGYDSIVYDNKYEGGGDSYILFNPNQVKSAIGNKGTYSPLTPDISYESDTVDRITKTAGVKSFGKNIQGVVDTVNKNIRDDDYWTKQRVAFVDKNSGLAKDLASQPVFDMKGQLRADMVARTQDQMLNYVHSGLQMGLPTINSDGTLGIQESENNLARSQILADQVDKKGITDINGKKMSGRDAVAEIARILRGKDVLAEDKARRAKGQLQLAQARALTQELKRLQVEVEGKLPVKTMREYLDAIKYLRKEGYLNKNLNRELQVKERHIKWAEATLKNTPEIKDILDIWKNVNDSLVTLWEKSGLFTKDQADEYRSRENYVPLFKAKEDLENGVNNIYGGAGTKSVKGVKKLQGSEAVRNIWENMNRHYASMVTAAYQNQTRKVATEQLKALGAAEIVQSNNKDVNLRYRDPTSEFADNNGIVSAIVHNPNTLAAFQMMHYELGPIMKAFALSTKALRIGALVNPMYWAKQLIRDPIHATLVGNSGIVTPFHALRDFAQVIAHASPEAKVLASRGVIGAIDPTTDIYDFIKKAGEERKDPNALQRAIHKVMRIHELSDAATRISVYKKAFADAKSKGMSEDQAINFAVHKARESINFAVRGNSKVLNSARHMIPFVSAQITSLDSVYRAMFAKHLSGAERAEAQRAFRNGAMIMTVLSAAYAMAYAGDDDYDKLPDVVKDNYWLIPNPLKEHTFIKIPIPFEVGYLFKSVPEASVRYMQGTSTGKEVLASYKNGLINNIPGGGLSPYHFLPQAIRPIIEIQSNYSNFTGRPIEGMSDQGKPVAFRGDHASEMGKFLSGLGLDKISLSPAKIDYLIQAYTAELGTFSNSMASAALMQAEGKTAPSKNIEELPGFRAFMTNPNSSKAVADFYDLDHKASELYTEFNTLRKTGQGAEAKSLLEDEQQKKLISVAPILRKIQTQMTNIHAQINMVKNNQRMSPDERRDRINQLELNLDKVAHQGYKVAESAGINR